MTLAVYVLHGFLHCRPVVSAWEAPCNAHIVITQTGCHAQSSPVLNCIVHHLCMLISVSCCVQSSCIDCQLSVTCGGRVCLAAQARCRPSWPTLTSWSASRRSSTPPRCRPTQTACCPCCSAWTSASRARCLGPEGPHRGFFSLSRRPLLCPLPISCKAWVECFTWALPQPYRGFWHCLGCLQTAGCRSCSAGISASCA